MLGMFIAHYGPNTGDLVERERWPYQVLRFTDGRAMPLFVFLAGAGFAMLVRRPPVIVRVAPRVLLLLVLGLWLEGGLVLVILHFYAMYFVVGLAIHRLPDWIWLALAFAVAAIGAWTTIYLVEDLPDPYEITDDSWWSALPHVGHPRLLLSHLVFTGEYRIFPSFAFFLLGMWIARRPLQRRRVQLTLVAAGLAMAVAGYGTGWSTDEHREGVRVNSKSLWWLLAANGHSQMPAWIVGAAGTALAVTGLCLLVAALVPRAILPFAWAGQLALTFYLGHVFLLRRPLRDWPWDLTAVQVITAIGASYAAFVIAASAWRRYFAQGPAEAVLRLPFPVTRRPTARG